MTQKTDADGYVTEYSYSALDLVSKINYNDTKEVTYQYNKEGELVRMDDWLGTTTFEVDLLGQLKEVTDHNNETVSYEYDAVGNQTSVTYPDETVVNKTYDELYQLTKVTDAESQNYTYTYDDAGNVTKLTYPNGWIEEYTYDAEGNLLKTIDTNGFNNRKGTKYEYQYDAEGNLTSEYKRATTAHDNPVTTTYTYDALNRITSAHEQGIGVNNTRNYEYDTLGNLIRVEQNGCDEYLYNGTELDQYKQCGVIPNSIGTSYWEYTYDNRGNLTGSDKYTRTTEGMKWQNVANYVYDETNHMVQGKNEDGEYSLYTYNGLGVRVGRELIMQDNTHGYTDFHDLTPSVSTDIDKPEVVKESYVVDYTTATRETLTMHEEGGFDYRWVYGLDKLSVKITSEGTNWWGQNVKKDILKDYTHQDRMGSTTNMTDQFGRVVGRADYNEWGEITYKEEVNITSAYRRIYPEANYTGHDWDDVLGMYYAKARFYDPAAKRFVAMDPVKGNVVEPLSLVSYLYCLDNPLKYVDPLGLMPVSELRNMARNFVCGIPTNELDLLIECYIKNGGNHRTGPHEFIQIVIYKKLVMMSSRYNFKQPVLEKSLWNGSGEIDIYVTDAKENIFIYEVKPYKEYYSEAKKQLETYYNALTCTDNKNPTRGSHVQRGHSKDQSKDIKRLSLSIPKKYIGERYDTKVWYSVQDMCDLSDTSRYGILRYQFRTKHKDEKEKDSNAEDLFKYLFMDQLNSNNNSGSGQNQNAKDNVIEMPEPEVIEEPAAIIPIDKLAEISEIDPGLPEELPPVEDFGLIAAGGAVVFAPYLAPALAPQAENIMERVAEILIELLGKVPVVP